MKRNSVENFVKLPPLVGAFEKLRKHPRMHVIDIAGQTPRCQWHHRFYGTCKYLYEIWTICKVTSEYGSSSVGWVDFALFWNFMKSHRFAVPLSTIWGTTKFFLILVQKPVRATPLKVHNFKKIQGAKKKLFWKNVFFNAYIILEDNQILNKIFFWYFFYFLKRVLFQKTSFA